MMLPSGFNDKPTRTGGADHGRKLFLKLWPCLPGWQILCHGPTGQATPLSPVLHWEVSGPSFTKQHVSMGEVVVFRTLCH